MSKKLKLLIAYDGTKYSGWQIQPNALSIQAILEEQLSILFKTPISVTGSGRTDTGVHALEQVAHFICPKSIPLDKLLVSLNGMLPLDIRILSISPVEDSFHARYSAKGKIYRYEMVKKGHHNPFVRDFAYHLPYPIDLDLLKQAKDQCIGTKDFSSFSNEQHKGSCGNDPVRTIERITLTETQSTVTLEFEGNGFLYKMVRNLVGTMLDIARGKIPLSDLETIFAAKNRKQSGSCAPAKGLFLVKVLYD